MYSAKYNFIYRVMSSRSHFFLKIKHDYKFMFKINNKLENEKLDIEIHFSKNKLKRI